MTTAELWESLLQGSVGAVIGIIGLFSVFWFTRRHEREQAAIDRAAQELLDDKRRTQENVARVVEASLHIKRGGPENYDDAARHMADELVLFSVRVIADHPEAAEWAWRKSIDIQELADPDQDIRAVPWEAGNIASILSQWTRRGFPDEFFPKPKKRKPRKKKRRTLYDTVLEELENEGGPVTRARFEAAVLACFAAHAEEATDEEAPDPPSATP